MERLRGATIAVTNKVPLRERELSQLPGLRLIAVAATGVDCVDTAYCRSRGLAVAHVPLYARSSVSEHVFMLVLALRRRLLDYVGAVRAGRWADSPSFALRAFPIQELHGATLGLIGYGALARSVESLARAFGMQVLIAERKGAGALRAGRTRFDDVLGRADVLSLHSPLTPQTRGLLGTAEFAGMKKGSFLINTARGGLIDEEALARALETGPLAGAGLDVLREEPPAPAHPLLSRPFANLIVTPHVAWSSEEAVAAMSEQLISNMESFVKGVPQNLVA